MSNDLDKTIYRMIIMVCNIHKIETVTIIFEDCQENNDSVISNTSYKNRDFRLYRAIWNE